MHDTNTVWVKPTLVMRDPNTFLYMMELKLMDLRISCMDILYQKHYKNYKNSAINRSIFLSWY